MEMGEMVKDIEEGSKGRRRTRQKEDGKQRGGNGRKGCMEQNRESLINKMKSRNDRFLLLAFQSAEEVLENRVRYIYIQGPYKDCHKSKM